MIARKVMLGIQQHVRSKTQIFQRYWALRLPPESVLLPFPIHRFIRERNWVADAETALGTTSPGQFKRRAELVHAVRLGRLMN
jgi:hypothetical protein